MLVLGFGWTGRELARRAKPLGLQVIGVRRSQFSDPSCDETYTFNQLSGLWERADILSLNIRHTRETHKLINSSVFEQLPESCFLLNGSRGDIIDQEALEKHLEQGRLGGAWLDVTSPEPLPQDSPLWSFPNVLITPHCADQVEDFPLRFAQFFQENLERYRQGAQLTNVVQNPS